MIKFVSLLSVSRICPAKKISGQSLVGICSRLMSANSLNSTEAQYKKWDLYSAVCLERLPRISADLNEIEEKYSNFMNQLEIENSLLSNHELRYKEDKKIAAKKLEEVELKEEEAARKTTAEFEDSWELEYNAFTPAPRISGADKSNDLKSLNRCLQSRLVLLVKQKIGAKEVWVMPQGKHQHGESMRQTAERILHQHCGKVKGAFLGNAPCGFYKYKYPVQSDSFGAKVFFFKAFHEDGNISEMSSEITDFSWLTKQELSQYLSQVYLESVNKFFIDL